MTTPAAAERSIPKMFWDKAVEKEKLLIALEEKKLILQEKQIENDDQNRAAERAQLDKKIAHDDLNRAAEQALQEKKIAHDDKNRAAERVIEEKTIAVNNRRILFDNLALFSLGICFIIGSVNFGAGNQKIIQKILSCIEGSRNLHLGSQIAQFVFHIFERWRQ